MNFIVKDKNNNTLCTGTKQDCMHFIKRRGLNRQEVTINTFDTKPAPHYTVPVTSELPEPKGFFKRIFTR
jgi:hypothetical protein